MPQPGRPTFGSIVYIDLTNLDEEPARDELLCRPSRTSPTAETATSPGEMRFWTTSTRRSPLGNMRALTQVMTDLGEVGKTQLALKSAYHHMDGPQIHSPLLIASSFVLD